ncbi:hypothetical protein PENSPDRAFT_657741 [Peniophora sp. CONT]|nr:hypothetical protein PENSPDRAFT_657741 [Peniophora sp. CONT]
MCNSYILHLWAGKYGHRACCAALYGAGATHCPLGYRGRLPSIRSKEEGTFACPFTTHDMPSSRPTQDRLGNSFTGNARLRFKESPRGLNTSNVYANVQLATHPRLQVLTIGINRYEAEHMPRLRGAVADADAVDYFCAVHLQVPRNQRVNLRNEQATREAILQEILNLHRRARRPRSGSEADPILIYFAGHGTKADAPEGWVTSNQQVSLLMPYDRVDPIPDRTIGALLHQLAEDMGDNITVILDCCHSGSGTRDEEDPAIERFIRGVELDDNYVIPQTLDEDIWGSVSDGQDRASAVAPGFAKAGIRSHVLLAACREDERAHETRGRGDFTRALLDTLWDIEVHKITYRELMEHILELPVMRHQVPQCEGYNAGRKLFNALAPSRKRIVHPVDFDRGGRCVMNAGSAQGVALGARFSIYPAKDFDLIYDRPLARMVAVVVRAYETELASDSYASAARMPLLATCFAFQTHIDRAAALRLYIASSRRPTASLDSLEREISRADYPIELLEDEAGADLCARDRDGRVELFVGNSVMVMNPALKLQSTIYAVAEHIHPFLRAASQFFWHLRRTPAEHQLRDNIAVELHELRRNGALNHLLHTTYQPYGENQLRCDRGVLVMDVEADNKTAYGITIRSQFVKPLYVWVFYFDCSDLSITEYYQPPAQGPRGDPSLAARGALAIGHGDGGAQPFRYFVRPGQDIDVGFIKLFILTKPVDLSNVPQLSPFEGKHFRGTSVLRAIEENAWDTILITVRQHRPSNVSRSTRRY